MTLEQSEFQRLVDLIIELIDRYRKSPTAIEAILSELRDMYKKVPIYPGIIANCLPKVIQPAQVDKLKGGDKAMLFLNDGRLVSGKVAGVNSEEITLVEPCRSGTPDTGEKVAVRKKEVKEVKIIVHNILEKEWPSLNFDAE